LAGQFCVFVAPADNADLHIIGSGFATHKERAAAVAGALPAQAFLSCK
jgi:hypothetical protein